MTSKVKNHNFYNTYSSFHDPFKITRINVFFTFIIVSICISIFLSYYCSFYDSAKKDLKRYHKTVFNRSMLAYNAQLNIPNKYKNDFLISQSNTLLHAIDNTTLSSCKKLWDMVFSSTEKTTIYNNKILSSNNISIKVITDNTCRYFLRNNNETLYFFDYALTK